MARILGLNFQERDDGLYLSVSRDQDNIPSVEGLKNYLDQKGVMNYNLGKIEDVINRQRGVPERVGDNFKYFAKDKDRFINIKASPNVAKLTIYSTFEDLGLKITNKDIEFKFRQMGIVHGVDYDKIKNILDNALYDQEHIIAKATPPQNGLDAKINEQVKVDVTKRPKILLSGSCNFREIENVSQIEEGQILAIKMPPTKGKDGVSVYGSPIPAQEGKDIDLKGGENTKVVEDGKKLLASTNGFVYRGKTGISVGEIYIIKGSVDFSVGNINYSGDVAINKDVKPNFSIKATGDIAIRGGVENAEIISKEKSITIEKGVLGKGKGKIVAGEDISVLFAQDCTIECEGNFYFNKNIVNCIVKADAGIIGKDIIGGNIKTYGDVNVHSIGNPKGVKTNIVISDKDRETNLEKIKQLEKLISELKEKLINQQNNLKNNNRMLSSMKKAGKNERLVAQIKTMLTEFQSNKKKYEFLLKQKQRLLELIQSRDSYPHKIIVNNICYRGTIIRILEKELKLNENIEKKELYLEDNEIKTKDF